MSAFMLRSSDIAKIVEGVSQLDSVDESTSAPSPNMLGQRLWSMNLAAIVARYPDVTIDNLSEAGMANESEYKTPSKPISPPDDKELTRLLRLFIYQCSEGNVPRWPLFKQTESWLEEVKMGVCDEED